MEKDAVTLKMDWRYVLLHLLFIVFIAGLAVFSLFMLVFCIAERETNWVVSFVFLALGVGGVILTHYCILEFKKIIKKRLILDAEGIKTSAFSVLWSEIAECVYGEDISRKACQRTLEITTFDNNSFSEHVAFYRFDKYELISIINRLAGRRVFDLEYAILQEKHDRVLSICMWGAMVAISASFYIFCFYCIDSKLSTEENIMWWCVIGVLMALGTYGSYTYMQSWNRRHNYKD